MLFCSTMTHLRIPLAQLGHILAGRSGCFRGDTTAQKIARCSFANLENSTLSNQNRQNLSQHNSRGFHDVENLRFDLEDEHEVANQLGSTESSKDRRRRLYDHHIPITSLQRGLLAAGSAVMSLYDPYRHDMVAVLGEVTGHYALRRLHHKMLADPEGRQILNERPIINTKTVDMEWLASLPTGTLGREYADFMRRNKITSDSRAPVHFVDDPDLAYVMQRYREIHDFNHALLSMPTTMLGEVAVKWFEMINTGLPMTALGALFGPFRVKRRHLGKMMNVYIPWVVRTAPQARLLLNVYFEKRWEQPLTELHNDTGIQPFSREQK